jgi:hypothetical protein
MSLERLPTSAPGEPERTQRGGLLAAIRRHVRTWPARYVEMRATLGR